jgi:hypothetical protein
MNEVYKLLAAIFLFIVIIFGATGFLVTEMSQADCEARTEYSQHNYKYVFPFSCIYTGAK